MQHRLTIHQKIRHNLSGTADRPRLAVYRSLNHISVQLIDDETGKTVAAASSLKQTGSLIVKANLVGKAIADQAKKLKIKAVVFDRGGFHYHGAVKAVAETVRQEGITV